MKLEDGLFTESCGDASLKRTSNRKKSGSVKSQLEEYKSGNESKGRRDLWLGALQEEGMAVINVTDLSYIDRTLKTITVFAKGVSKGRTLRFPDQETCGKIYSALVQCLGYTVQG